MSETNSAHGKNFQKCLLGELGLLAVNGKLHGVITNYGLRHPGYSSPNQYYAPLVVTVKPDIMWAVFTTTTCRTDRIKGQQWDAEHLKSFCPAIKRAFLVYPDNVKEADRDAFVTQKQKYDNKWEYSCIDNILSVSELIKEIENA